MVRSWMLLLELLESLCHVLVIRGWCSLYFLSNRLSLLCSRLSLAYCFFTRLAQVFYLLEQSDNFIDRH